MTITIDCRMIDASGVGVYLRECLPRMLDSSHSFTLLGDPEKILPFRRDRPNVECVPCSIKPFSLRELFCFPPSLLAKINQSALFYSPYFNIPGGIAVPVYTTIHDVIFPDMPGLVSKAGLAARMWFYRRAARRSAKIFTVSEFSESRIKHHLGEKTRVVVTYNGVRSFLAQKKSGHCEKKGIILFIGNIKKHKGLGSLLDAFQKARAAGLTQQLVIAGGRDNFRTEDRDIAEKLERLEDSSVSFTGFVPDGELENLLGGAALLVQPSLYEGFGYPPLEAMASGTPALISDIPVFREIYAGFPVTFFEAGNSDDLAEKLMLLLHDREPERLQLPEPLLRKYTFEKTAGIILRELGAVNQ